MMATLFYSPEGKSISAEEFVDFVLQQYINQGVGELDQDKLPDLLELKYHALADAVNQLGDVGSIRETFVGFQKHLYG